MTGTATLGGAVADVARRLQAAGVPQAVREARLLAAHALNVAPETVFAHPERPVDEATLRRLDGLAARRADREPHAYVVGVKEFWSLRLGVSPDVLTPRPDTETVVETALDLLPADRGEPRVLDIGTGSGCLLLAVLSARPTAVGIGIDRSAAAVRVARANALATGLAARAFFCVGDWLAALGGRFDLILCNPPYVATRDISGLAPEIAHEPRLALDGGPDGLDAFRAILPNVAALLTRTGVAAFEVGDGQAAAVAASARAAGLQLIETRADLDGRARCLAFAANAGAAEKKAWKASPSRLPLHGTKLRIAEKRSTGP